MLGLLAAIFSAIIGFGASVTGITSPSLDRTQSVITSTQVSCYTPNPKDKIVLNWNTNFKNVSDPRATLNPSIWGSGGKTPITSSTFDTDLSCKELPMDGKEQRTFVLIRGTDGNEVRIPSCKTDELAGPKSAEGPEACGSLNDVIHRGSCDPGGYTELRKIADAKDAKGSPIEVYWTPYSHNVACGYSKETPNCGPGVTSNMNMKDMVYVLAKDKNGNPRRDAFPPDYANSSCTVTWDAGTAIQKACSHYFKIYMAEDLYNKCLTQPTLAPKVTPTQEQYEDQCYFFNQVVRNCTEKTIFIPAAPANLSIPPEFIAKPFTNIVKEIRNNIITYNYDALNTLRSQRPMGKVVPEAGMEEPYAFYTYSPVQTGNRQTSLVLNNSLLRDPNKGKQTIQSKFCSTNTSSSSILAAPLPSPTPVTPDGRRDCLEAIGTIRFAGKGGVVETFYVYSNQMAPQTFLLMKSGETDKGYEYTVTDQQLKTDILTNDPSLQLAKMEMIMLNEWTWGTPRCKPAIYLYPEKETDLNIKLKLDGDLTLSDPIYNAQTGWNVKAYPDGTIYQSSIKYPYLYYEANIKGVDLPKEGWVVPSENLKSKIENIMRETGFNEKETADFLAYWLPKLTEKPYYFVTLLPEEMINNQEQLTFSTAPDTLIRTRFIFEGLDYPVSVAPLTNIPAHARSGFVATDWGGTLVGKSCEDLTIK